MLIIGLGNPDRGDDAAGILVAQRLRERGVNAVEHAGATLNLLDLWSPNDHFIIVDAVISGTALGSIHVWDPWKVTLKNSVFRSSTHEFSLGDTVELARALNRLPSRIQIYGIEARGFELGTQPCQEIVSATERLVEEIRAMVSVNRLRAR
jgi:hydrogenase maturation protease